MTTSTGALLNAALQDQLPSDRDALTLATQSDTKKLAAVAAQLRDRGFGNLVTYSRKVFIPLTLAYLLIVAIWIQSPWNIWN